MPTTRIAIFLGTRPEAIKLAPVIRALEAAPDFEPVVISTGQHREMLDQVAQLFGLTVHHDLQVMRPDQTLSELTARLLVGLDELLGRVQPALGLVQGDTTTVLAASLACFYRRIPVGHVEAGLRTGDRYSPFPEELNRSLTTRLCTLHFAPTAQARDNLIAEGIDAAHIEVTGNTVIDALQAEVERQTQPEARARLEASLRATLGVYPPGRPLVLITGHRRENFGRGFEQICGALGELAQRFPDHDWIYPVHLNPNVLGPVRTSLSGVPNVRLLAPLPYGELVALMRACRLVLTDSGGIQEEAPSLGKPVLVMRDTTERPEGVAAGTVRLVGADREQIVAGVSRLLRDPAEYSRMALAANPYGDGHAAERILVGLRRHVAANG